MLAYKCNGVVDVVVDSKTGYLVPPRDVDALVKRGKQLLKPATNKRMGAAGRKRALEVFTWDNCVDGLLKVYKK